MHQRFIHYLAGSTRTGGRLAAAALILCAAITGTVLSVSGVEDHPPAAVFSEEIRFFDGSTPLAGTLYQPEGETPRPALVVITGSDRSARTPIRRAIGREFAKRNIAALIYDSPGTGSSGGNALMQSRSDRVVEALAAVRYLRGRKEIRPESVGLYGVSEGADVIIMAAARDSALAFAIPVSASAGGSLFELMRYSAEKRGYRQGLTHDEIARAGTFKEAVTALLIGRDVVEWSLIEQRSSGWDRAIWPPLIDAARQWRRELSPPQRAALLDTLRAVVGRAETRSWYRVVDPDGRLNGLMRLPANAFFMLLETSSIFDDWDRTYRFDAGRIRCPLLAIWGTEDEFLPPHRSAERLREFLSTAGRRDFSVIMFEGANHTLTTPGEQIEFVPGYFDSMAHWIHGHTTQLTQ